MGIRTLRILFPTILFFCFAAVAAQSQREIVREVQTRLADAGFDAGPADGLMGPRTREAIRGYQQAKGLTVTGRLDEATLKALEIEVSTVFVPAGTRIHTRLNERLASDRSNVGDRFTMTVGEAVAVGGTVVVPSGAVVTGTVAEVEPAERPQKGGKLLLRPVSLQVHGESYALRGEITAEGESLEGEGSLREDLGRIGLGAGVGGVVGGIIGGRRGALIGVIVGGGGTFLGTRGEQVELPVETRLIVEVGEGFSMPLVR
jgi:peptidoglycan hydrolase-like protein with peptidoglycan-binding domain